MIADDSSGADALPYEGALCCMSPDHRLENRDRTEVVKKQFPVVRQAMEQDFMIKDFHVSEKGHGSYWMLGILRWVMVLIFVSFGIQKFTP